MHWADFAAQTLSQRGNKHIIASGITPSGEFHIGHLREILTGDMITRACKNAGMDAEFVFIVDHFIFAAISWHALFRHLFVPRSP